MKRFYEILIKDLDFGHVLLEETVSSQKELFRLLSKYKGCPCAIRVSLFRDNYHFGDKPDTYFCLNCSLIKTDKDLRFWLSRFL